MTKKPRTKKPMKPAIELIRLFFTQNNVCLGSYEKARGYYASDFFVLPTGYNPVGKSLDEIEKAIRHSRSQAFLSKYSSSNPLDLYREFNYYECQGLK